MKSLLCSLGGVAVGLLLGLLVVSTVDGKKMAQLKEDLETESAATDRLLAANEQGTKALEQGQKAIEQVQASMAEGASREIEMDREIHHLRMEKELLLDKIAGDGSTKSPDDPDDVQQPPGGFKIVRSKEHSDRDIPLYLQCEKTEWKNGDVSYLLSGGVDTDGHNPAVIEYKIISGF